MPDGADLDDGAGDLDLDRLDGTLAQDGQSDRLTDGAAHHVHGLGERKAADRFTIDLRDQVARKHARVLGRCAGDRRDHLHEFVFHGHFDAEAAELAARLLAHILAVFGVEVGRMGIERGQHAVDRGLDQFGFIRRGHISRANALEDVAEDSELTIGFGRRRVRRHHGGCCRSTHQRTSQHERKLLHRMSFPIVLGEEFPALQPFG